MKKVGSLAVDDLVQMAKMIFAKYGLLETIISNSDINFTSETFRQFCRKMNIQQSITSSYHHQSNGQVEACIKLVKSRIKKCLDTNQDVSLALLQIQSTPIGAGLPGPTILLFNRPIKAYYLK